MSDPVPSGSPLAFVAAPDDAGVRLDLFLASKLTLSRAAVRRLLARGVVRVDDRPAFAGAKGLLLGAGMRVDVTAFTPPGLLAPPPEPEVELHVLAQGPGWLAVDKPAGVPVHPLAEGERATLLGAVVARHPEIVGVGEGGLRSGVVHRLDVDTSGVVLFATDAPTWDRLRGAFRAHRVEKRYRAIARGRLPGSGRCELMLAVTQHRPARVRVVGAAEAESLPGARRTRMSWRTLEALPAATLVEVTLETGFLHQIRASFADLGHPLVGDAFYGVNQEPEPPGRAPRQMLHAASVRVDEVDAESPDPPDFTETLARLRAEAASERLRAEAPAARLREDEWS